MATFVALTLLLGTALAGPLQDKILAQQQQQQDAAGVEAAQATADLTQSAMELVLEGNRACFANVTFPSYPSAEKAYREARKLEPKNTYVLTSQATCHLRRARELRFGSDNTVTTDKDRLTKSTKWFDRANGLARIALSVNGSYGSAHFVIAEVQALRGQGQQAVTTLNRMETDNLIPEGRESAFYAWRAYAKKQAGQDFAADIAKANELFDPVEFAEFATLMKDPEDTTEVSPPVAPWP